MKAIRKLTLKQLDEDWYWGDDAARQDIIDELHRRNDTARIVECMAEDARDDD